MAFSLAIKCTDINIFYILYLSNMKKYFLVVILVIGLVFTVKSQSANLIFSSSWFGWTENEVLGKLVNSEIAEAADIKFYSEKKDEIRFTWRMDSPGFPAHFTYSALTTCYFKNGILYKVEETYRSVDNKKQQSHYSLILKMSI